jgi:hypothetical protein
MDRLIRSRHRVDPKQSQSAQTRGQYPFHLPRRSPRRYHRQTRRCLRLQGESPSRQCVRRFVVRMQLVQIEREGEEKEAHRRTPVSSPAGTANPRSFSSSERSSPNSMSMSPLSSCGSTRKIESGRLDMRGPNAGLDVSLNAEVYLSLTCTSSRSPAASLFRSLISFVTSSSRCRFVDAPASAPVTSTSAMTAD